MSAQISFEVITLEGLKFQEDVWQVELPTPQGAIGILPHHIPLLGVVVPGVIAIKRHEADSEEKIEYFATEGGFVEIDGKHVRLLADSAERAEDIDEMKAQQALVRAQEMKRAAKDQVSLGQAESLIEQQVARIKVAGLRRRKK